MYIALCMLSRTSQLTLRLLGRPAFLSRDAHRSFLAAILSVRICSCSVGPRSEVTPVFLWDVSLLAFVSSVKTFPCSLGARYEIRLHVPAKIKMVLLYVNFL